MDTTRRIQKCPLDTYLHIYQFCQIPFEIINCVACFQQIIENIIMRNNLWATYAYVANIVAVRKTQEEHKNSSQNF